MSKLVLSSYDHPPKEPQKQLKTSREKVAKVPKLHESELTTWSSFTLVLTGWCRA